MVGTARFELATTCPPDKCATRLRYAPIKEQQGIYHPLALVSRKNMIPDFLTIGLFFTLMLEVHLNFDPEKT